MDFSKIKFDERGLVPAIVQDATDKSVLMMAYMNAESLQKTIKSGETWFYSRSRESLWHKGETSGHFQKVREIRIDCDGDTLLILADQTGAACHSGNKSCFFRDADGNDLPQTEDNSRILDELFGVIEDRKLNPKPESYTNYLFDCGIDKILKKVGEECSETIIAAKNAEKSEIALETSDLLYHLLVMLSERNLTPSDIYDELRKRR